MTLSVNCKMLLFIRVPGIVLTMQATGTYIFWLCNGIFNCDIASVSNSVILILQVSPCTVVLVLDEYVSRASFKLELEGAGSRKKAGGMTGGG